MKGTIIRNGIEYSGGGGSGTGTGGTNIVEITSADYEALSEEEKNSDILYLITDSVDGYNAGTVVYDDTETNLGADNVQDAIETLSANFTTAASEIGDALVAKGVDVPDGTSLSEMAALIEELGGGSEGADEIRAALVGIGVIVPEDATLSDMADLIANNTVSSSAEVSLTGSKTVELLQSATQSFAITFEKTFGQVPTISIAKTGGGGTASFSAFEATATNITKTGFTLNMRCNASGYIHTATATWTAVANSFA